MRRLLIALTLFGPSWVLAETPHALSTMLMLEQAKSVPSDSILCVEVDGKDPSKSALEALRKSDTRFVAATECEWVVDSNTGSREKSSGRRAYFVSVSGFQRSTHGLAIIKTTVRHHGKLGIFKTLEVRKSGEKWHVEKVLQHTEA